MSKHTHTSRAILLLHTLHPDWQILDEVGKIMPDFNVDYFQSVAFGLQQIGMLRYSTATRRRETTDKGKDFARLAADAMRRELNMPDCQNVHALIRATAAQCQQEQAQWMRERYPEMSAVYDALPQEMKEEIDHAN